MAEAQPIRHRRRRRGKASLSGFFRDIFTNEPDKLFSKSNEELIDRWKAAHPNHSARDLQRVRQNLANVKSQMKKRHTAGGGSAMSRASASGLISRSGRHSLETLEESIDECMVMAKHMDREGLGEVIRLLRRARNEVVLKNG